MGNDMEEFELEGITISVAKKKIKNMYLRVTPPKGDVKLTAPMGVSDDCIRKFALSKLDWMKKQRERCKSVSAGTERDFVTGESCYLWGKRYILDVQNTDYGSRVFLSGENLVLRIGRESTKEERERALNDFYRRELSRQVSLRSVKKLWECRQRNGGLRICAQDGEPAILQNSGFG